jgi:hypothetical protein
MNTFFQLWDTTTGNIVTEFDSEHDAIEALIGVQAEDGDAPLLSFALFRFQHGRPTLVAKEHDLVHYIARAISRGGDGIATGRARLQNAG